MTQEHPITPPPELVRQWAEQMTTPNVGSTTLNFDGLVAQAARWGADQELEACRLWVSENCDIYSAVELIQSRRPNPQALREQALDELQFSFSRGYLKKEAVDTIRRALESLPS